LENTFCFEECQIGKTVAENCLALNDSIFEAVYDFNNFTEICLKTCPYKDMLK
jgi:hypothetical protein